jgi:hypothetical protein
LLKRGDTVFGTDLSLIKPALLFGEFIGGPVTAALFA